MITHRVSLYHLHFRVVLCHWLNVVGSFDGVLSES